MLSLDFFKKNFKQFSTKYINMDNLRQNYKSEYTEMECLSNLRRNKILKKGNRLLELEKYFEK